MTEKSHNSAKLSNFYQKNLFSDIDQDYYFFKMVHSLS